MKTLTISQFWIYLKYQQRSLLLHKILLTSFSFLLFSFSLQSAYGMEFVSGECGILEVNMLISFGQYVEALNLAKANINKLLINDRRQNISYFLFLSGVCNWEMGRVSNSRECFSWGVMLPGRDEIKKQCYRAAIVVSLYELGKKYREENNQEKALLYFGKSFTAAKENDLSYLAIKCLRQVSSEYWDVGRFSEFFTNSLKGLYLARSYNNIKEACLFSNNIGLFYWRISFFSRALLFINKAHEYAILSKDIDCIQICSTNLAIVNFELGQNEAALERLREVILYDENNQNTTALVSDYNNMGLVYKNLFVKERADPDAKAAVFWFTKALALAREYDKPYILNNLGRLFLANNEIDSAISVLKKGEGYVRLLKSNIERRSLFNSLAFCYIKKKRTDIAFFYLSQVRKVSSEQIDLSNLWELNYGLGECYYLLGNNDSAIYYYKLAIKSLEKINRGIQYDYHRASFMSSKADAYNKLIILLYNRYICKRTEDSKIDLVYHIQKAKIKSILESIQSNINAQSVDSEIDSFINGKYFMEATIRRLLTFASIIIVASMPENNLNHNILSRAPEFDLAQIIEKSRAKEVLFIDYCLQDEFSIMIIIDKGHIHIVRLPCKAIIRKCSIGAIKYLADKNISSEYGYRALSHLWEVIVKPYLSSIPNHKQKIIISPDDILCYLSFEALIVGGSPWNPEYLVDYAAISYLPALVSYEFRSDSIEKEYSFKIMAFGYAGGSLALDGNQNGSLRSVDKEIMNIKKHFNKKERLIFQGKEATYENFLKYINNKYIIIHFACHGIIDKGNPGKSGIILSQNEETGSDSELDIEVINTIRIKANVVILSTCYSANGDLEELEGIMGLTRALYLSGASAVISAMWTIEDGFTSVFMEVLYNEMENVNNLGEAFDEARRKIKRSGSKHPYYWASFRLYGNEDVATCN